MPADVDTPDTATGTKTYSATMSGGDYAFALQCARYEDPLITLAPFTITLRGVHCLTDSVELGALEVIFENSTRPSRDQPREWNWTGRVRTRTNTFTAYGIVPGTIIGGSMNIGPNTVEFVFTVKSTSS